MVGIIFSWVWILYFIIVEMDTATFMMGDCLKYINDLEGDGLDDAMM